MIESKQNGVREVTLIDKGRGVQLSTSRITGMDLVQYLRVDWPYEKTIEIIPSLTRDEFAVIERYYRVHKDELNAEDDRVEEYREEQLRIQRERIPMPDETSEERIAQLRALLKKRQQEANGDGSSR
jgi:hypothetical protein